MRQILRLFLNADRLPPGNHHANDRKIKILIADVTQRAETKPQSHSRHRRIDRFAHRTVRPPSHDPCQLRRRPRKSSGEEPLPGNLSETAPGKRRSSPCASSAERWNSKALKNHYQTNSRKFCASSLTMDMSRPHSASA